MKRFLIFSAAMLVMVFFVFGTATGQTTINRADIPMATYFYMPVGDRDSCIEDT